MYDLGIMNGQLYRDHQVVGTNLYIEDGQIAAIDAAFLPAKAYYETKGAYVLPGLIDPHVHFALNVGAYTSSDDFYSGSVCAAFGGVTTFIDFLDPISKASELKEAFNKRKKLAEASVVDYSFHLTVANPVNQVEAIVEAMKAYPLNSIKLFTTYSDSNRRTYEPEIETLLKLSKDENFVVLAHIEKDKWIDLDPKLKICDLLVSRPTKSETVEALKMALLAEKTKGHLYMVHLSSGETLKALVENYANILGTHLYIESCPHYFHLDSNCFERPDGYNYLLAPPIRTSGEKQLLKAYKPYIHTIGTDHCPFMTFEKKSDVIKGTPMGIGGIEHSFILMYQVYGLEAVERMSEMPAKIFGLYPKKGSLNLHTDADITIFNPKKTSHIGKNHSRCDFNAYKGLSVEGAIISTLVRGEFVVKNGQFIKGSQGKLLERMC